MVVRAMAGTLQKLGGNPGRSGHALSLCGGRIIQRCRELLAEAFDAPAPENVIFFPSCTEALNTAIRGTLCEGDEVILSLIHISPSSSRPIQVPSALPSPVLGGAGATVGLNVGAGEAVGIGVGAAEVVGVGVGFIASHTA